MKKVLIFDLGGVLFIPQGKNNIFDSYSKLLNLPAREIKVAFDKEWDNWRKGKISEKIFWKHVLKHLNKTVNYKCLQRILYESVKLDKQAYQFLKRLKNKNTVYFLSNNVEEWFDYLCKKYDFKEKRMVYSSFDFGTAKPADEFYKELLNLIGEKSDNCIFIDDKEQNLKPAKRLGMETILYRSLTKLKRELKSKGVKI